MQTTMDTKPLSSNAWAGCSVRLIAMPIEAVSLNAHRNRWWVSLSHKGILPVVAKNGRLMGILRQDVLLMSDSIPPVSLERAEQLMTLETVTIQPHQTIADVMALFDQYNLPLIPIVDTKGRYTGECASYMHWYRLQHGLLRPARVGGFATPFGVYLTSGVLSGGAGWKGLIATGVLFGIGVHFLDWASVIGFSGLAAVWPDLNLLSTGHQWMIQGNITILLLFAAMRFSPLSGLHAAEHMTVSAIEQNLPLSPENVRPQPREHIRCGTNLMVLLGSLQFLVFSLWILQSQVNLLGLALYSLFWILVAIKLWQPIGLRVQRYFTTKPPTDPQLASGIRAGEELLAKFAANPHPSPSLWRRLWGSRLFHLLAMSILITWLVEQLVKLVSNG